MKKIRLALITGGTSNEREVALSGAAAVEAALNPEAYIITRYDAASDIPRLITDRHAIDFAFLVVHGENGEDGRLQGLLDLLHIPYQGSGVLGSALACNKLAAKEIFFSKGLLTPRWETFDRFTPELEALLSEKIGLPLVIKPAHGGSSLGMSIVHEKKDILKACELCLSCGPQGLAEPYIRGRELTCAVWGDDPVEALPVIEIRPGKEFAFFDYTAKYTPGATEEICPAPIPPDTALKVQKAAVLAHKSLYCEGYSRSDFILRDEELYILETNTLPGMTKTSLLPLAARTAGIPFPKLIDGLIQLRLKKGRLQG
ncbi:D-alanine--D-alanine ligase [Desulfobotulus sp.]|jgi:D-alanine-D-alanine ligase|uniref:D-alanine--D-alanine ligase family protein n=1 Tax=Desulfobotulus sp. TaxID=1940337 RepID=UPI002A366AE8|nr:D-alanine--D-alanine ligase [Desulfobotulus sp.]MDY0162092.1 D-alanine--D-alanine ligase [Desulfobotulus sp.]